MSFLLPPLLFVVFAAIFSGTSGPDLKLKVGVADIAHTRIASGWSKLSGVTRIFAFSSSTPQRERAQGIRQAGKGRRRPADSRGPADPPRSWTAAFPCPGEPLAAPCRRDGDGAIQRTFNEKLPDVALARILADVEASGAIGSDEREFLDDAFRKRAAEQSGKGFSFASFIEHASVQQDGLTKHGNLLSYAGAVVAVFLLFAGVHGAFTLLDERASGIAERFSVSGNRASASIAGKLIYLTMQGTLQAIIVYATAYLLYGARFDPSRLGLWLLTCILAAAAASALALAMCALQEPKAGGDFHHIRGASRVGDRRQHGSALSDAALVSGDRLVHAERLDHSRLRFVGTARGDPCGAGRSLDRADRDLRSLRPCRGATVIAASRLLICAMTKAAQRQLKFSAAWADRHGGALERGFAGSTGVVAERERLQGKPEFRALENSRPVEILESQYRVAGRFDVREGEFDRRRLRHFAFPDMAGARLKAIGAKRDKNPRAVGDSPGDRDRYVSGARRACKNMKIDDSRSET